MRLKAIVRESLDIVETSKAVMDAFRSIIDQLTKKSVDPIEMLQWDPAGTGVNFYIKDYNVYMVQGKPYGGKDPYGVMVVMYKRGDPMTNHHIVSLSDPSLHDIIQLEETTADKILSVVKQ